MILAELAHLAELSDSNLHLPTDTTEEQSQEDIQPEPTRIEDNEAGDGSAPRGLYSSYSRSRYCARMLHLHVCVYISLHHVCVCEWARPSKAPTIVNLPGNPGVVGCGTAAALWPLRNQGKGQLAFTVYK